MTGTMENVSLETKTHVSNCIILAYCVQTEYKQYGYNLSSHLKQRLIKTTQES